jgi:hypothetical protein
LSGVEKAKIIKYLQDHDYKVFTNEAYKEFMAQNKPIKEETTLSSPPFYIPHIPKCFKTPAFHSGSTYIPKLSIFSGDPARSDVAYEVWKYEVECLLREGYSDTSSYQEISQNTG